MKRDNQMICIVCGNPKSSGIRLYENGRGYICYYCGTFNPVEYKPKKKNKQ